MEKTGRKRSNNYTNREKEWLISLVEENINVIENKKTNAVFNKEKYDCWEAIIAPKFNSIQTTGIRSGAQLKSVYEQMKKSAKKHKSDDKVQAMRTGGGVFTSLTTMLDEKVLELLKFNYFNIDNDFDNNATSTGPPEMVQHEETIPSPVAKTAVNVGIPYSFDDSLNNIEKINLYEQSEREPEENEELDDNEIGFDSLKTKKRKRKSEKENKNEAPKGRKVLDDQKAKVLEVILEAEKENLKGKKLDNEIKDIIKARELLELEFTKKN